MQKLRGLKHAGAGQRAARLPERELPVAERERGGVEPSADLASQAGIRSKCRINSQVIHVLSCMLFAAMIISDVVVSKYSKHHLFENHTIKLFVK